MNKGLRSPTLAALILILAISVGPEAVQSLLKAAQTPTCSSPGVKSIHLSPIGAIRNGLNSGVVYTIAGRLDFPQGTEVGVKSKKFGWTQWSDEPKLLQLETKQTFCLAEENQRAVAAAGN